VIKENGEVIQGTMDTSAKFTLMFEGVDLNGKTLLDVGCNSGMMTYLASKNGALATGLDIDYETVKYAKSLFPNLPFYCGNAESISGSYDIILASAILHYVDLDKAFRQFSRCAKQVICDIWLHPSEVAILALTRRGIYIPSLYAFLGFASKYFSKIESKGPSPSPDDSKRFIYHLSNPILSKPKAVLISGDGDSGKSTLSYTFNYPTLALDQITHEWFFYHQGLFQSVSQSNLIMRGDYWSHYLDFYSLYITNWLNTNKNRDIVIEGFDLSIEAKKNIILGLLNDWTIEEIKL